MSNMYRKLVDVSSKSVDIASNESVEVIIPPVLGYRILSRKNQTVISEHGPGDLQLCRELVKPKKPGKSPSNIIRYLFEIEETRNVPQKLRRVV